jgi:DNA-binding transcriptional MerR regulator
MKEKEASPNRAIIKQGQTEQLRKLCQDLDQLREKTGPVGSEYQAAYEECVAGLKQKKSEVEEKLVAMDNDSTDGFYERSLGSQIALDEMQDALRKAREQFNLSGQNGHEPA